jgi:coenzyme F420-0:L-glutamate ligase/coenzyme F420-1:gamma-L-glutamate ligase
MVESKFAGGTRVKSFTVMALESFPLVREGDDLARMIVDVGLKNGLRLEDGDIVVVAQKVLSKAEGRVVKLSEARPSTRAKELAAAVGKSAELIELILGETRRVLKASREILLVEDKHGLTCINAGLDKSNVEGRDEFALLPQNPDESAEKCRVRIGELTGKRVGVIVCDTYSRPFRRAQVNFAIGYAGICPFRDYRGKKDLFGRVLKVKNIAVVDELAASAELLMGQGAEARPVVILRGLREVVGDSEREAAEGLYMSREEDLFRGAL